ncbi:bifunctional DNA-binding transcriptional regulator/O6-methylguanine-DNA methyltransferase Ada [Acidihalobacter prosperus]|uniref:methylated-DNA--[protein]-cysteine S-methyltransferase n=1 Tax=Acidihalobacter prosperus TaxID=160660 RepID=A0A1A6C1B0_9GAMM|nr:bifunctional DNA-binding transcriptional regulator/O6-methylguanine-DNA methyltransferase Ada [Acidihalobacter prosperus]OBS08351.1 hypothetical protein Thpro_022601 [Acidihalobacter prosperus]
MTTKTRMPTSAPPGATTNDPRWVRILARDAAGDGEFWYSVATTGVYCRPSCPSRRPRPENVRFHATPEEARALGFRPCRRCNPDGPSSARRRSILVERACRMIESGEREPTLAELAADAGLSPSHFHRLFKTTMGMTPKRYAAGVRLCRVREGLAGAATVTDAIYAAGFGSSGRFYEQARAMLGMPPETYRKGGGNEDIRFAVGEASLGAFVVASSAQGVVSILIGDDPEALLRDLQDRFPRANLIGADAGYEGLVARVVGLIDHPGQGVELPLDIRGTAFQQRVWQALRAIPPGQTASYSEIAQRIGRPASVRAVAGACAANPLAVAIPCHRVVRRDGSISGYAWGIERKRALLDSESGA